MMMILTIIIVIMKTLRATKVFLIIPDHVNSTSGGDDGGDDHGDDADHDHDEDDDEDDDD